MKISSKKFFILTINLVVIVSFVITYFTFPKDDTIDKRGGKTVKQLINEYKQTKIDKHEKGIPKKDRPSEFTKYLNMLSSDFNGVNSYNRLDDLNQLKSASAKASSLKSTKEKLNWIQRGPGNVGGRTRGFVIDMDDDSGDTWFAAPVDGGVWKTTDAGKSWSWITPDWPLLSISSLAMAPSNHNVMYAGTGEHFSNSDAIEGNGIFKTTDKGVTWTQLPSTMDNDFSYVNRLIIDPDNEDNVVAVTHEGILKTTDGGETWEHKYQNNNCQDIVHKKGDFSIQIAGIKTIGIARSNDGGETWYIVKDIFDGRIEVCASVADPNYFYALTAESELYISTDSGETWEKVKTTVEYLSKQGWYNNTLVGHPTDKNIVYIGGIDIYRVDISYDSNEYKGASEKLTYWYNIPSHPQYAHADHHNLLITEKAGTPFRIIDCSDGGISISDDKGDIWQYRVSGYVTTQYYGVSKHPTKNKYIGGAQDNGTLISDENPTEKSDWNEVVGGDGFACAWNTLDTKKIICSLYNNKLKLSKNGGKSWVDRVIDSKDDSPFVTQISYSQSNPYLLFAGSKKGVWRSENFGNTWELIKMPGKTWEYGKRNPRIAISPKNSNYVWAATAIGYGYTKYNPAISTDGGKSFKELKSKSFGKYYINGYVTSITPDPKDINTAYLTFAKKGSCKIAKTTDLGKTWTDITGFSSSYSSNNGFPDVKVYSLVVMPYNTDIIWAGTSIGIVESTDGGNSWHIAENGLPNVCVWDMKFVGNQLVVGTHGLGVWSLDFDNYTPNESKPYLNSVYRILNNKYRYSYSLQTDCDKVEVVVNGNVVYTEDNVSKGEYDMELDFHVDSTAFSTQIKTYKNNYNIYSNNISIKNIKFEDPRVKYITDFNDAENNFFGNMNIITDAFGGKSINTDHKYSEEANYYYTLTVPIIVDADYNKAVLTYDDIAVVEAGKNGIDYGNEDFYDYVVVQASYDGKTWFDLDDGYDIRYNNAWKNINKNNIASNSSALTKHTIHLHDKCNPGSTIIIRFRLFSDRYSTGWGWLIDNLSIQPLATSINYINQKQDDFKIIPNVIKSGMQTSLYFISEEMGDVVVDIYNLKGQKETSFVINKSIKTINKVIDTNDLSKGMKLVTMNINGKIYKSKILIK